MAIPKFLQQFFPRRLVLIQSGQKWPFQMFFQQFFQKRLVQIQNGQKSLSEFFPTISQKDWKKFGMAKNGHSEFI